jgi:5-methylcytosine-specific restriction enzyme subunit McrC
MAKNKLRTSRSGVRISPGALLPRRADRPSGIDVAQVVAYAQAKGCLDAVLIYPTPLAKPLDEHVGTTRVRSATFALDGALEDAGKEFLSKLGSQTPLPT